MSILIIVNIFDALLRIYALIENHLTLLSFFQTTKRHGGMKHCQKL